MRLRLFIALVAAGLIALGPAPANARAKDAVVARDTLIQQIWALDGDVVYWRDEPGKKPLQRAWMVRFKGHLHRADGIPRTAGGGALGLDAKGRKVFTFVTAAGWFVYDLAGDRVGPAGEPPTSCRIDWLSIWRDSMAYETACADSSKDELFVRRGNQTNRISSAEGVLSLSFRAGTLAVLFEDGNDNMGIARYAASGQTCIKVVPGSVGDATDEKGWFPTGRVQIVNGYIAWTMGDPVWRSDYKILAARVAAGCKAPEPVGAFPFKAKTARVQALAVDNRAIFYADGKTLRRQSEPARVSIDPPANDKFKHARKLSGDLPLSATGDTAFATVEPGEPLAGSRHTVWYAFRAKTTQRAYVTVSPSCSFAPAEVCNGLYTYGVYTGSRPDALTQLPKTHPGSSSSYYGYTRIDALAGHTYWIAVGSFFDPNHEPFTVHVATKPVP